VNGYVRCVHALTGPSFTLPRSFWLLPVSAHTGNSVPGTRRCWCPKRETATPTSSFLPRGPRHWSIRLPAFGEVFFYLTVVYSLGSLHRDRSSVLGRFGNASNRSSLQHYPPTCKTPSRKHVPSNFGSRWSRANDRLSARPILARFDDQHARKQGPDTSYGRLCGSCFDLSI
jgi:hypothetical protein